MVGDELEEAFWRLWWDNQNDWERSKKWFPLKRPMQIPEEFLGCLHLCSEIKDPFVLEIGTMRGIQKRFWVELLGAKYIGVDVDPEAPADIHCQSGTAHAVDAVLAASGGRKPNIVFIDGDHSYSGAKSDWDIWRNVVADNGLICFHDIHHDHDPQTDGAARLWRQLTQRQDLDTLEFFHKVEYTPKARDGTPTQCGIGVVRM